MSVKVGDRKSGKLQVLNKSRELLMYTLKTCTTEKVFPKSKRWVITQKITNECIDAVSCIRRANSIRPTTVAEMELRHLEQIKAHSHLGALYTLIDISYEFLNIEDRRIEHWTKLVDKTDKLLKAWIKSDKK